MRRAIDAGAATEVLVGTLTIQPADVDDRVERGFDYQIAGTDVMTLTEIGERIREEYADSPSHRD